MLLYKITNFLLQLRSGLMNKQFFLLLSVVALIPGCGVFRSKRAQRRPITKQEVLTDVDIPVSQDSVQSFFDEDLDALASCDQPLAVALNSSDSEYSWIDQKNENGFKKVYFDFDKYSIKTSEKESVAQDIAHMKELLAQEESTGQEIQFVINGNADHYAGSDYYNRILSERRAKTLKDHAVAAGIPEHKISIIGRGSDIPELVNGKPCTGDKDQQAPNRRDEIQVIVA